MFLLQSDIFFWDILILLLLAVSLCGSVVCIAWVKRHPQKTLQKLCVGLLGCIAFASFALTLYGSFIEPQIIVVTEKTLSHPLSSPMTIAVISDIHVGPYKGKKFVERVVDRTNALLPDIILLPGDFIFLPEAELSHLDPLQDLRPSIGTFAVLGNHDVGQYETLTGVRYSGMNRGDRIENALTQLGITVLRNTSEVLPMANGTVAISGIDDLWTGHADLVDALSDIDTETYTILMSHNPSVIDEPESMNANLIVSGHTHGGQIRLPHFGPMSNLPTSLGKEYDQGLFEITDNTTLAITRGIGESSARTRLFAWPEILLLRIE